jgi:hypothetical protein
LKVFFQDRVSQPGLTLNCDPPDLCLPSSYDYRHEPLAPSFLGLGFELRASCLQGRHYAA